MGACLVRAAEVAALVAAISCLFAANRHAPGGYVGLKAGRLCGIVMPPRAAPISWEAWMRPAGPGDRDLVRWGWDYWSASSTRGRIIGWAVPLWPVALVCGAAGGAMLIRRKPVGACAGCGYDLGSLPQQISRCPECGASRTAKAPVIDDANLNRPRPTAPCPRAG
jgi:hypothetical protein